MLRRLWIGLLLRSACVFALATLGVAGWVAVAQAAVPTKPYSLAPTRACLVRAGVRVVRDAGPSFYPEEVARLQWRVGKSSSVFIVFARNSAHGAVLLQRYRRISLGLGATDAEVRRMVIRRENVVWYPNSFTAVTPKRSALIARCLR